MLLYGAGTVLTGPPGFDNPAAAQTGGAVPGGAIGAANDSESWRAVRRGVRGTVSIPDKQAGVLIQSEGDNWRAVNNGPVKTFGGWLLLATVLVLAAFFAIHGRVRVESGVSGRTIERYTGLERFAHWLTATSFVVLALTGLNITYGRYVLLPIIGSAAFSAISGWGKYAHNFVGFAFAAGIVLEFVLWVKDNLPDRYDITWLAKGGGLFAGGRHLPATRFNAGQKLVFWMVVVVGLLMVASGVTMLFPFYWFGMQGMQLAQLVHVVLALLFVAAIIAHIYLGTIGTEGAFGAMATGVVDENWARKHHSVWASEILGEPRPEPDRAGDD